MARGIVDILLRFKADSKDVNQEVAKIDQQITKLERRARDLSERRQRLIGRGSQLAGDILEGGSPQSILNQFIPQAGLAFLAYKIAEFSSKVFNDVLDEREAAAEKQLQGATSGPQAGAAFLAAVNARTDPRKAGDAFRRIGDVFTGKSGIGALFKGRGGGEEEVRRLFRAQAASDPYFAAAILANLPPELQGMRSDFQAILKAETTKQEQQSKAAEFRASLRPKATRAGAREVSVTNVYTAFDGLGGQSTVGREVRATLDRRDRNNGRYVTQNSRR